jgi:NADH:ubiquinone reductase (H+-translocating)
MPLLTRSPNTGPAVPHVVVVGAGFGGLAAVRALASSAVQVTLVDRRNFHLFQPLLYQVATAALNPSDIAWPIRSLLRGQRNAAVVLGEVTGVDLPSREVRLADGRALPFDHLIIATGATHTYFGKDHWAPFAPGLKRIDDATLIRRRVLMAFERAENCSDPEEQQRLLSFVLVGGGPTGVELAGAIAELAHKALAADFRRIQPGRARIVLIEGAERILSGFCPELSHYAQRALEKMGVEVCVGRRVIDCDRHGVTTDQGDLPAATVLWAAGIAASPAANWLGVPADRAGRVVVDQHLTVPGLSRVYVIGDTAAMQSRGTVVPGIAPAAKQAGRYVAHCIQRSLSGRPPAGPFRYRHYGSLATIGRHSAVIDWGRVKLRGGLAWLIWGTAHVYFLLGARHRLLVAGQWVFNYLTYARGARLIAGSDESP